MADIDGNNSNNNVTVSNGTDANGVPLRDPNRVTITKDANTTVDGIAVGHDRAFFDVSMRDGNDSLTGENMNWTDEHVGIRVAFDDISMGKGDDTVDLFRSAFDNIDMGAGHDRLLLDHSGGNSVDMGSGQDAVSLGDITRDVTLSDAEMAQKDPSHPMVIDGGDGFDTLNLQGPWTLTLSSGSVWIDTDANGVGDLHTNTFTNEDVANIVSSYPTVLDGTVAFDNGTHVKFKNFEDIQVICFTAGTLVDTPAGKVAIETLREGDLVTTRKGNRPVQWIGKRTLDSIDLAGNPKLLPIRVPAGAFGNGLPTRDVSFSPQHRVVVRSTIAERMFGSAEVLVSIKQLVGVNGIDVDGDVRSVQYLHVMLEEHEILSVEGIEAESLYPGRQAISFLNEDQLREIRTIFPNLDDLVDADQPAASAQPFLKGRESRTLAARHAKNAQPLYA
ncbi:Hint domain-containing protein [Paracoccus liaowanqingii]|uniref:Hint domain-containing protein n=1 Tax=Paracoccus liaowanqingii TaxID=2560053 RepID=A0A4Z1BKE7_9RHOB|nr:Hint domain-containing protein [Paracoccus liaowanqingii]TGN59716.1 Hint domain-containing protein [Paracoccus liaowanqingii]